MVLGMTCAFGGNGGGKTTPVPATPAPAPPTSTGVASTSRTVIAKMLPRRTRQSTILTSDSSKSKTTILGTPLT